MEKLYHEGILLIVGLCVGSFLNVLIDRLPRGKNVLTGRSVCDYCRKTLRWFELIPILSFLLQHGRCRRCHKRLSWQYPLVELVTGAGFVVLPWTSWMIFSALLVIFVADLKYRIIPDSMVAFGLLGVLLQGHPFWIAAFGAAAFFLLLWRVTRGHGMGLGDVKLAFLMGLFLGYPKIIVALYTAFLTGAVVGVILVLFGKKKLKSKIAFGPFLVVGTAIALLYGDVLIRWWYSLL